MEQAALEARDLPCTVEEADSLAAALELHRQWVSVCNALLEGHFKGDVPLPSTPDLRLRDINALSDRSRGPVKSDGASHGRRSRPKTSSHDPPPQAAGGDAVGPGNAAAAVSGGVPQPRDAAGSRQPVAGNHTTHLGTGIEGPAEAPAAKADTRPSGEASLGKPDPVGLPASGQAGDTSADADQRRVGGSQRSTGSLSTRTLMQLLKSTVNIELDVGNLPDKLIEALSLHQWRARASAALKPGTKFTGKA